MKRHGRGKARAVHATVIEELRVDALAAGGDGVAHVEHEGARRAVFVRGAVPGDVGRVEIDFGRRPAHGRLLDLVTPSAERVPAPCPHFAMCGGCPWMILERDARERAHVDAVREVLPSEARDLPIAFHRAARDLGYRTRTRLHVSVSGGRARVGLHAAESHRPVEVDACLVLHAALERARAGLAALFEGAHGEGEARLALGRPAGDDASRPVVLDVRWPGGALPAAFFQRLERAVQDGDFAGARVRAGEARVPAVVGDPTPWLVGADGEPLELPAGGFAQASEEDNRALAVRVDELAREALGTRRATGGDPPRVVELYAGAGNFSVLLARSQVRLVSVEGDEGACRAATSNLRARGLAGKVTHANVDAYPLPRGADLVVLDPPRTGAREVVARFAEAGVKRVVYVSCDPATLGRDLAKLVESGYRIGQVEVFEMFPQTSHVETVVRLDDKKRAERSGAS